MTKKNAGKSTYQKTVAIIVVAVVAVAICATALLWPKPSTDGVMPEAPAEGAITVSGTAVCLPHKDTSGPQTLECALGLKAVDGRYYGLKDTDPQYRNVSGMPTNSQVTVTGTFKERPDSKYPTVGIIEVTDIKKQNE